jgi:integrase
MPPNAQHYFKLLIYTGQRRSNVAGMRWADVDLERGTWTISAGDFKTGVVHAVPLIPAAVEVLEQRTRGEWVFPADSKKGHLVEPHFWAVELRAKMKELGVDKSWTIHDLRRTTAATLNAAGVPLPTIAKVLGHANVNTTPIYARAGLAEARAALAGAFKS